MDAWKDKSGTNKLDRVNKNNSNWKKILYTTKFSENDSQGCFELYCLYFQCFFKSNSEHLPQKRWYWEALTARGDIKRKCYWGQSNRSWDKYGELASLVWFQEVKQGLRFFCNMPCAGFFWATCGNEQPPSPTFPIMLTSMYIRTLGGKRF